MRIAVIKLPRPLGRLVMAVMAIFGGAGKGRDEGIA
jgi:hypothetical protein